MAGKKLTKSAVAKSLSAADVGKVLGFFEVHQHENPRCKGGKHNDECTGKKKEVLCKNYKVKDHAGCLCLHMKV